MNCPNCHSDNVTKINFKVLTFITAICTASFMLLFGLLFFPFIFFAVAIFLLSPLAFAMPIRYSCKQCKKSYGKKEYSELTV